MAETQVENVTEKPLSPEKKINWTMSVLGSDGTQTYHLTTFEEQNFLGKGRLGKVYRAKTVYAPKELSPDFPPEVAVKTSDGSDLGDKHNRLAVERLIRVRNAAHGDEIGLHVFPRVLAVNDPENKGDGPFSYAMKLVPEEVYRDLIYMSLRSPSLNSLLAISVIYTDAVELLTRANIAQNDRKLTDILWFDEGGKLKILDWDAQVSVSAMGSPEEVAKMEQRRLGAILLRTMGLELEYTTEQSPQGDTRTTARIKDQMRLRTLLPEGVFQMVMDLTEGRGVGTLEDVKLRTLMVREKIKDDAQSLTTYNLQSLEERLGALRSFLKDPSQTDSIPIRVRELYKASVNEGYKAAVWEEAVTETAIHLKALEFARYIGQEYTDAFDQELAKILFRKHGEKLTRLHVLSALRERLGLEPLEEQEKVTAFNPGEISPEVLVLLYRMKVVEDSVKSHERSEV